jgi:predicted AlkP superfamily phosphohydrolase/phosphomutase
MNGFLVQYKRASWSQWVVWPCKSRDEVVDVKRWLVAEGYQVLDDGIEHLPKTLAEVRAEPTEQGDRAHLRHQRWLQIHRPKG